MKKIFTLTTIGLIGIILVAGFHQTHAMLNYNQDTALQAALEFLKKSPTFTYDGLEETLEVIEVELVTSDTWHIVIHYTSRYAGYGDRTDMVLLPVLTPHETIIIVARGEVISATTDGVFDEVEGLMTPLQIALDFVLKSPTYIFDGIPESLKVVEVTSSRVIDGEVPHPLSYDVLVYFESGYSGYGERSGEMLLTVITPHEARLIISEGKVLSAVMDGVWDMLSIRLIE